MNFFYFCGSFLPSWIRIRIRIQITDPDPMVRLNTDPDPDPKPWLPKYFFTINFTFWYFARERKILIFSEFFFFSWIWQRTFNLKTTLVSVLEMVNLVLLCFLVIYYINPTTFLENFAIVSRTNPKKFAWIGSLVWSRNLERIRLCSPCSVRRPSRVSPSTGSSSRSVLPASGKKSKPVKPKYWVWRSSAAAW